MSFKGEKKIFNQNYKFLSVFRFPDLLDAGKKELGKDFTSDNRCGVVERELV